MAVYSKVSISVLDIGDGSGPAVSVFSVTDTAAPTTNVVGSKQVDGDNETIGTAATETVLIHNSSGSRVDVLAGSVATSHVSVMIPCHEFAMAYSGTWESFKAKTETGEDTPATLWVHSRS